jgi:hypothetical protein
MYGLVNVKKTRKSSVEGRRREEAVASCYTVCRLRQKVCC